MTTLHDHWEVICSVGHAYTNIQGVLLAVMHSIAIKALTCDTDEASVGRQCRAGPGKSRYPYHHVPLLVSKNEVEQETGARVVG